MSYERVNASPSTHYHRISMAADNEDDEQPAISIERTYSTFREGEKRMIDLSVGDELMLLTPDDVVLLFNMLLEVIDSYADLNKD